MLKTLLERRLTNLDHHAKRMKAKYYPDWDTMWKEGEIQYVIKELELKSSLSMEEKIKEDDGNLTNSHMILKHAHECLSTTKHIINFRLVENRRQT